MKFLSWFILFIALFFITSCGGNDKKNETNEKTPPAEVINPEKVLIGQWNIDEVTVDFDMDKIPESARPEIEANPNMLGDLANRIKGSLIGQSLFFNDDGTSVTPGDKRGRFSLSPDGKTLNVGAGENDSFVILSMTKKNMTLFKEDQGMIMTMMLTKTF